MRSLNFNKKCLFSSFAASLSLCGCGNGPADPLTEATVAARVDNFAAADFTAKESMRLRTVPVDGAAAREIELPEGIAVSVIETKVHPELGTIARLGIDADENENIPSDAWFVVDRQLLDGLRKEDTPASEEDVTDDEGNPLVDMVRKRMTYCFRYVKRHLMTTGQVNTYLPGERAFQAATILPKHGFRRTGSSPASAKNGEVCVYSGGPQGHGHVEVKKNGKWWFGYGYNSQPMSGRKFIACFNK